MFFKKLKNLSTYTSVWVFIYTIIISDKMGKCSLLSKRRDKMSGRVTFEKKSDWQKDDCINRNRDYQCPNQAVLEAVCKKGNGHIARVRCCTDKRCKKVAALLAAL